MKPSNIATTTFALAIFLLVLASCGKAFNPDMVCIPNFSQGNIGLKMTYVMLSMNEYEFEVCYNDSFQGSQVSVYGVPAPADLSNVNTTTDIRLAHITDGLYPGDRFTVTFANNDTWFIIYEDGSGSTLSTTTEIIRGEFR